jgi:hypothetical protein
MEKKREGNREAAGEVFLSSDPLYHCFFGIGDEKGELLKLLLAPWRISAMFREKLTNLFAMNLNHSRLALGSVEEVPSRRYGGAGAALPSARTVVATQAPTDERARGAEPRVA